MAILASIAILLLRLQASVVGYWLAVEWMFLVGIGLGLRIRVLSLNDEDEQAAVTTMDRSRAELSRRSDQRGSLWTWLILATIGLPPIDNWIQTAVLGMAGEAIELQWLAMLQYGALGTAHLAVNSKQHWMVMLMSSFLMLFGLSTSDRREISLLVGLYGLLVAWWLMARHWRKLERGFVAVDAVPLVRMRLASIGVMALAVIILGYFVLPKTSWTQALSGFMPTSGGRMESDDSARGGVGDGERLVAAKEEAFTFGPVDSDLFLESQLPSLYDMVSEVLGQPKFKKRKTERAVALNGNTKESSQEGSESHKGGQEFSTLREALNWEQTHRPSATKSRAVAYLIGRVPQHLRLEAYDSFDGTDWFQSVSLPEAARMQPPTVHTIGDQPWIRATYLPANLVFSTSERLAVKLIRFRSPRVIAPSFMTQIHIDRVDREDFFGWTRDGQLQMVDRETVPPLTIVHQTFQLPRLHVLRARGSKDPDIAVSDSMDLIDGDWQRAYLQVHGDRQELAEVAIQWLGRQSDGSWRTVEKIVEELRTRCQHDRNERVPNGCQDSVRHFLSVRSGPDYLFASTAVMLLRSLGYPCRLVNGFYASPDRFDHQNDQTVVMPEDLHTWLEVYCQGAWIPVEPTPGYQSPLEHRTWAQWAIEIAWLMADGLQRNPASVVLWIGMIGLIGISRIYWLDGLLSLNCVLVILLTRPGRSVSAALRLVEWRCWLLGLSRRPGTTIANRLRQYFLHCDGSIDPIQTKQWIEGIQRQAYAPKTMADHWIDVSGRGLRNTSLRIARQMLVMRRLGRMGKQFSERLSSISVGPTGPSVLS